MHKWFERRWRSTQKKSSEKLPDGVVWNVRVTEGDVISREPLLHERKEWDDVMCEQHVAYYSSIYPALQRIMTKSFFFILRHFKMTMGSPKFQSASRSNCFVVWDVWPNLLFFPGWSISAKLFDFVCQVMYSSLVVSLISVASNHFISFSCSYIWRQEGGLIGLCTSPSSVLTFCLHRRWQGIWIVPVALLLLFGLLGRVLYLLLLSQFAVIRHPNGAIITAWAHVFELSPSTEKEPRSRLFVMAYYLWGKVRCSSRRTIHQGLIAPRRQWMGQPMLVVWSLPISNV